MSNKITSKELLIKITHEYDSHLNRWITVKHYVCW